MTAAYAAGALVASTVLLAQLGLSDPKRLRGLRRARDRRPAPRRLLGALAILPGAVLAGIGDAAAFLVWLGGSTVMGWLIAALLSRHSRHDSAPAA